jgi:hypothetical protein
MSKSKEIISCNIGNTYIAVIFDTPHNDGKNINRLHGEEYILDGKKNWNKLPKALNDRIEK